ncbi:MAG: hypothetical protein IT200_09695 [Thermoleophilia bacterium]|nr:hypothetical protein [Thermoleophilia bacterium]
MSAPSRGAAGSGLPPLTPRPAPPAGGLPPLRTTTPPRADHVMRVREVQPRWRKWLLIGCAVVSAAGGAGSLYLQMAGGGKVVERVAPVTELAERTNNGIAHVDTAVARIRALARRATPARPGEARSETRVGPFVIRRGPGYLELRPARP